MSKITGFVGNENEYNQLVTWIKQPNTNFGNILSKECITIVSGYSGSGKSHGIKAAINEANKNLCYINKDECINSKDFKELILKQTQSNIIDQFNLLSICGENLRETVIFIDDVDTLLAIDRSFINNFNLLITCNTIKTIKIILSCITSELKLILKSIIFGQLILLKTPTDYDIKCFLNTIYQITGPNSSNNLETHNINRIIDEAINTANGDISVALNVYNINIRSVRHTVYNTNNTSNTENTSNTNNTSNTPNANDTHNAENAENAEYINNQENIQNCVNTTDIFPEVAKIYFIEERAIIRKVIEQDPWLHPLRFHENIIHEFKQRKGTKEEKNALYIDVLQQLCRWDQIMTLSKGSDITNAVEQACNTVILMTKLKRKKIAEPPVDEFTRMFNYLSLRKKNMISLYEGTFPWESIGSARKKIYDGYIRKEITAQKNRNKIRLRNNTKKLCI